MTMVRAAMMAAALATGIVPAAASAGPLVRGAEQAGGIAALGWQPSDERADRYRPYYGRPYYGPYYGHRHRRGVSAGDVVAGVLILGGIAAIASAASKSSRERAARYPDPDGRYDPRYPAPDARYDPRHPGYDGRGDPRYPAGASAGSMDAAADACASAAERQAGAGARVESVSSVTRDGDGWQVQGELAGDRGTERFLCGTTRGEIDYLQIGEGAGYNSLPGDVVPAPGF